MYGTLVEVNFAAVVIITFLKKLAYPEAYKLCELEIEAPQICISTLYYEQRGSVNLMISIFALVGAALSIVAFIDVEIGESNISIIFWISLLLGNSERAYKNIKI